MLQTSKKPEGTGKRGLIQYLLYLRQEVDDLLIQHLLLPFSHTGTKNHKACFEAGTLSHALKRVSSKAQVHAI